MDKTTFRRVQTVMTFALAAFVGWSIKIGNVVLPLIGVVVGMMVIFLLKRKVEEVIEDERIYMISEKASRRTIQFFGVTVGLISAALIALSRSGYTEFEQIGSTLGYVTCTLLVVYMMFYGYYSKKFGE